MNGIRIAILGWNENTLYCVKALVEANIKPSIVMLALGYDYHAVKVYCNQKHIKVLRIAAKDNIAHYGKDCNLLVSASWPYYIKAKERIAFPLGASNVHASLLPKYRGQHPLNWAIINDEKEVGVTIHLLDSRIDGGDILLQSKFKVKDNDTLLSIRKMIHKLSGKLLLKTIKLISRRRILQIPQDDKKATFAPKRNVNDGRIDWSKDTRQIYSLIRGVSHPAPGAFTYSNGKRVILWRSKPYPNVSVKANIGQVIKVKKKGFFVKTRDGLLEITEYKGPRVRVGATFS